MTAASFSASIVTYHSDIALLRRAIESLTLSVKEARDAGVLSAAHLVVVDNGPGDDREAIVGALQSWPAALGRAELVAGHGNVGYGRANNLALARITSDVHLVMNPDVELDRSALIAGLHSLVAHPGAVLLAPAVTGKNGCTQYLCRRDPSVAVLFLRGFAPRVLRERFADRLARYEMRDALADRFVDAVPLASGCFMLMRTAAFRRVGGFDARYFMYFEDYDLSRRMAREGTVAYEPAMRIVHYGGEAARKGWRHVGWFTRSAWRFFSRHGWKLA